MWRARRRPARTTHKRQPPLAVAEHGRHDGELLGAMPPCGGLGALSQHVHCRQTVPSSAAGTARRRRPSRHQTCGPAWHWLRLLGYSAAGRRPCQERGAIPPMAPVGPPRREGDGRGPLCSRVAIAAPSRPLASDSRKSASRPAVTLRGRVVPRGPSCAGRSEPLQATGCIGGGNRGGGNRGHPKDCLRHGALVDWARPGPGGSGVHRAISVWTERR